MPILSLQTNRAPQFPCIGKLRKGGAKRQNANGKEIMGQDLNYFRFVSEDAAAAQAFAAYYGQEPTSINVLMPYRTADENFNAWLEEYRAGGMLRRCDGQTCSFHRDANGAANTTPIPCVRVQGQPCNCKAVGRLSVIIPELARLAWVMVETHSLYDIMQLTENLQAAEVLRGSLQGIPFILSRRDREISTPDGKGGRARRTKSLLFLEPDPSWVQRQLAAVQYAALPVVDMPVMDVPAPRQITGPSAMANTTVDDDDDEEYYEADPPAQHPPKPSAGTKGKAPSADAATLASLTGVAEELFGLDWPAKEEAVAEAASKGAVKTVAELTGAEAASLLRLLSGRLARKRGEAPEVQEQPVPAATDPGPDGDPDPTLWA